MKIGDIVRAYRLEHKMSLRQFAEKTDYSHAYIRMLENGINSKTNAPIEPSIRVYKQIAKAIGIDFDTLVKIVDNDSVISLEDNEVDLLPSNLYPIKTKKISVLGNIAAGTPIPAEQEYENYAYSDSESDCDYMLRVDGDSMESTVKLGDFVFIHAQDDVEDGQIAAVIIDDSATLKRIYHIKNGLQLISDNPKYPPKTVIIPDDCDSIQILGKAVAFKRCL